MKNLHVAIVGAGPAGSSAATFLARRGAKVTLLEKHRFPRDKVCGDGLTPRALWMLDRLGLKDLPVADGQMMNRVYIASPGGVVLKAPLPAHIFGGRAAVVAREVLDHRLVEHAVQQGAELREGQAVLSITRDAEGVTIEMNGGETLRADIVLGCDGSPSVVRRQLGAPDFPADHSAFAVRVYYENLNLTSDDAYAMFWDRDLLPAYGWIFPLPGGRANVGLGIRADHLAKATEKLPQMLDRFVETPRAKAELAGGRRIGKVRGHHLPFGSFRHQFVFDRALLLGDAAGFINPLTGEGIEFALESGEIAADVITEAYQAGNLTAAGLSAYAERCNGRFRLCFDINWRMQRFFETPSIVDRVFRAANRSPRVLTELAEVLLGESPRISWRLIAAVAFGV